MASASRLNKRVTIQVKTTSRTDTGSVDEDWNGLATVWARTWGASGQERQIASMGERAKVARHFAIRHFPYLSTAHRVVYAGTTYNVTFVDHRPDIGETVFDGYEIEGQEAG